MTIVLRMEIGWITLTSKTAAHRLSSNSISTIRPQAKADTPLLFMELQATATLWPAQCSSCPELLPGYPVGHLQEVKNLLSNGISTELISGELNYFLKRRFKLMCLSGFINSQSFIAVHS